MRYAQIRSIDISNGTGIGVALFVQGCHFHCKNCFNPETWDFNGGKEWTDKKEKSFLEAINKDYIHRVSILGGEPLTIENIETVTELAKKIKSLYPDKVIWIYTGYILKELYGTPQYNTFVELFKYVDYFVEGRYIDSLRDITLPFRGSKNQVVLKIIHPDNIIVNVSNDFD